MGIAGLHVLLKSIQKPCHLKSFKGQTLGVDAYGWLHRGTVACAIDLAFGRETRKYIDFVLNRVRMLTYFGVTPYLVFDGDMLPSKAETESSRAARREESKKTGMRLYNAGRVSQAHQELQKAVDVTPYMARLLIEELKKMQVQYIVAPYEADAQLVYLEKQGVINGILSEDSDMLVFGAKRLLSKLDQQGECIEINRGNFMACRDISLIGWTDENFRQMCILSGCDYLQSIPGMGLKTAYRYIRKCKSAERAVRMVQFDGKSRVPAGYFEDFKRAELTFLHQRVFCPTAKKLVLLNPLPADLNEEEMPYIGHGVDDETAIGIACGDLDPMTKEAIEIKQSSYPERERMVLSRRQTLPSATEKRPTDRITSFFTPKRVPLGELDPNSLTPSPSQQQVLEGNTNRAWEASPAPARPSGNRSFSSTSTPRNLPTPSSRNNQRQEFLARAAALPQPQTQPFKRQRLCSDTDEGKSGLASEKSRFFAAEKSARTPKTQVKKPRKAKFGVFSDDSVDDMMAQLPDSVVDAGTPQATQDTSSQSQEHESKPDSPEVPSEPNATAESSTTESSLSVSVDSDPALFSKITQHHVEQQNLRLRERFSYTADRNSSFGVDGACDTTPSRPTDHPNRRAAADDSQLPRRMARKTPLQRLGEAALGRSKSLNALQTKKGQRLVPSVTPNVQAEDGGSDPDCAAHQPVPSKGSEDFLVPDSQDEDDELDEPEVTGDAAPTTFDVKKFAYGG